jgi:hypothetical protein
MSHYAQLKLHFRFWNMKVILQVLRALYTVSQNACIFISLNLPKNIPLSIGKKREKIVVVANIPNDNALNSSNSISFSIKRNNDTYSTGDQIRPPIRKD